LKIPKNIAGRVFEPPALDFDGKKLVMQDVSDWEKQCLDFELVVILR